MNCGMFLFLDKTSQPITKHKYKKYYNVQSTMSYNVQIQPESNTHSLVSIQKLILFKHGKLRNNYNLEAWSINKL